MLSFCAAALLVPVASLAKTDALANLLARMDKSAASFQSMSANLTQLKYTQIINEKETQNAVVKLKRTKDGLFGRVDFTGQDARVVGFAHGQVMVYTPKAKQVEIHDVKKYGQELDQFLLLGFGTSGKELEKNYSVRWIGDEQVNGHPTSHIELTPKSKEIKNYFEKADLWMNQGPELYPVQEKIQTNATDYMLYTYSNVKLNPPLSDSDLELKIPDGVERINPDK